MTFAMRLMTFFDNGGQVRLSPAGGAGSASSSNCDAARHNSETPDKKAACSASSKHQTPCQTLHSMRLPASSAIHFRILDDWPRLVHSFVSSCLRVSFSCRLHGVGFDLAGPLRVELQFHGRWFTRRREDAKFW